MSEVKYEPGLGEHIDNACKNAVVMAQEHNCPVQFTFNDIELIAQPDSNPETLSQLWNYRHEQRVKEYESSPEFKIREAERLVNIKEQQAVVDECVNRLSAVLESKNLDEIIRWLARFGEATDWVGVEFEASEVLEQFQCAGFRASEGVGKPPEWFNTRERMGRYLVGQFMNCWEIGSPVPSIIPYWCKTKYFEVPPGQRVEVSDA